MVSWNNSNDNDEQQLQQCLFQIRTITIALVVLGTTRRLDLLNTVVTVELVSTVETFAVHTERLVCFGRTAVTQVPVATSHVVAVITEPVFGGKGKGKKGRGG